MKYLVTGGAGFIGSHLVDRLLRDGAKVVVLDNFATGKRENLKQHTGNKNLTVYSKDIAGDIKGILKKERLDVIFHLAAIPRVQFSLKYPGLTHHANINGTFNLLQLSKDFGVKRLIFASSSSIYGDQVKLPLIEDMTPKPISPYALHKLVGEYYCRLFYKLHQMETLSLRLFNVFGPRQNPGGDYSNLIPRFIYTLRKNMSPTINGSGKQSRDFTYVDDVVDAFIFASKIKNNICSGEIINIGGGKNISVNQVVENIINLVDTKAKPKNGPAVVEPKHTLADISKAKRLLGWTPKTKFSEGLRLTYEYFSQNG